MMPLTKDEVSDLNSKIDAVTYAVTQKIAADTAVMETKKRLADFLFLITDKQVK